MTIRPFRPFSEIPFAATLPALTDTVVGVVNKTTDVRFTLNQLEQVIGGGGGGGGGGSVTEIDTGVGLTGGPINSAGTIALANTAVTPGTYTNTTLTVDQQGRLTFATTGSATGALAIGATTIAGGSGNSLLYEHTGLLQEVTVGSGLTFAGGTLSATGSSGGDPLLLTQGLDVSVTDPTFEGNPNYNRAVNFNATFDKLISNVGFTDQSTLGINLNFNAGLNIFNSDPQANAQAKYTPIALNVGGTFIGAGEKFMLALTGNFFSMGDSFMMSGNTVYAGGPIAGDEGQGYSPAMQLLQPNGTNVQMITAVTRTTYSATITTAVTGSQNAQNIAVSTTTGANVGDWIVINQSIPSNNSAIWATQILSINPGVSVNCVCPINCAIATTITPALCLNLNGGGNQFGEGRVLVDYSGASYSTGTVSSVVGAGVNGSGTTWTNSMVGGNALNIGAIYFDIDTLSSTVFSTGTLACRSVYQIYQVENSTKLDIFSNSTAGDASYRGRAVGQTGLTYKILPAARILLINPLGSPTFSVVCETSTHTWTIGDTVECVICPYPDVHGWDYRLTEWTAGGNRRFGVSLQNDGARAWDTGFLLSGQPTYIGNVSNLQVDGFSWTVGLSIASAQQPIQITTATSVDGTTYLAGSAIRIIGLYGTGADTAIEWPGHSAASLMQVAANNGMDFAMGEGALFRSIGPSSNIDTHSPQLIIQGYLQLCGFASFQPYLRIGGTPGPGSSIANTFDLEIISNNFVSNNTLQFFTNSTTPAQGLFGVTKGGADVPFAGANVPSAIPAVAGVNQLSQVMQLSASVWDGSVARNKTCQIVSVPDSLSTTSSTVSMQLWVWDQIGNSGNDPNVSMAISSTGIIKFGRDNLVSGGDKRVTLDPSNLTAPRAVTVPNVAGGLGVVVAGSTTPASSGAAGTPGTIEFDGSFLYVCVGTNTWVRSALVGGW